LLGRALTLGKAFAEPGTFNDPRVHAAQIGAANCITNAASLSRLYAGLIGPVEGVSSEGILKPDQIEAARQTQTDGADRCLMFPTTFGLGFMTSGTFAPFGGAGAFGHPGAGGSVGFADPDNGIAFGYVMNQMLQNLSGDPRTIGLIRASYEAAGAPIAHA
jgi:CubicO group peptidase (beta-lactamase class C family)